MPDEEVTAPDPAATDGSSANARDGAAKRRDPNQPAAVVGLGASAGGVAVLQEFFEEMDPESGLAFVVVMHLAPDIESNLAQIIQGKTAMPVRQVKEPVKVLPNHIYVIPPNKQLLIDDSTLRLVEPQQAHGRRVTIDLFFRTLAQSYGQRSVMWFRSNDPECVNPSVGKKFIQPGAFFRKKPCFYVAFGIVNINVFVCNIIISAKNNFRVCLL